MALKDATTTKNGDVFISIPALRNALVDASGIIALGALSGAIDILKADHAVRSYDAVQRLLNRVEQEALDNLVGGV
jgi:hypothetical protein